MFQEERLQEIIDIVNKEGKVFVKNLSEKFDVSNGMIRKDLQKLESLGKLTRTYGGAIANNEIKKTLNIDTRMHKNIENKHIIAKKAFNIIKDSDTLFFDISSINFLLAELIANSDKKITLITNMSSIPELFKNNSNCKLILVGGIYNKELGGTVGSETISTLKKYRFDKAFIGSSGINLENGDIYNFDLEEGNTKQVIINSSNNSYILMENEKFYSHGIYTFSNLNDINGIVTDKIPNKNIIKTLKNFNVELYN
ncbi:MULTISPECIES: DeoR/GlpR family DNA-binding transcription regulator [Clostridium]|uniref:Lactose phosphotransferase system repressor n=1 Tax=Clostridium botulinum (strain Eklund 17B / Type B) TaxID=935198 RepID=B2TJX6_CLOBB|nr:MULTISPECIES: DeoR/GlpR family DNA-binding transcription regulator [Clostridium]ACD24519.1 transcriptional regulator, DeoR family [Clostridium botulinum B str. Eklund 17B (NRP)]MBN1051876.1 DeoR/GlpR transcriptional regulator [Clostridium botulinum]MBN1055094.1 DeoR/GlpR transcriptional regulator [Clostridium botulinum]MBY6974678.1 DeoR/GlpR transcriptional regulator [Clostridium botulinum]MBY6999664.1 DeoR/GlpR transcriptional regulator [Clostridium botulinum]